MDNFRQANSRVKGGETSRATLPGTIRKGIFLSNNELCPIHTVALTGRVSQESDSEKLDERASLVSGDCETR